MKPSSMWKVAALVAATAAIAIYVGASRSRESVVRVESGPIERHVVARAVIVPVDGVSEIRTQIDARVLRVHVAEGDHVEAGQLLVELDATANDLTVARAKAEVGAHEATVSGLRRGGRHGAERELSALVRLAEREVTLADDELSRTEKLHAEGAVSPVTKQRASVGAQIAKERLEALRARYDLSRSGGSDDVAAAEFRLTSARAALRLTETEQAKARIVAQGAGSVLVRRVDPGDVVRVIDSQPMFELADTSRIELRAEIEEMQTTMVHAGAAVVVAQPGGNETLGRGKIARVGPNVARRSIAGDPTEIRADSLVRAVFVTLDPGTILSMPLGQRVEVRVELEPRAAAARVPRGAVALRDGHAIVEIARGLLREQRAVQLGAADEHYVEVRGVEPGTSVVMRDTN